MRKVTSVRVRDDLWRAAKALAALEGTTVSSLLEEMLIAFVKGAEKVRDIDQPRNPAVEELISIRAKGKDPFVIDFPEKTAVELVKEGRGD